jgi:hypothetical protein
MTVTELERCVAVGVMLTQAADYGWLVRIIDGDEPGSVLACIEQCDAHVELMEIIGGFRWTEFASLHHALDHVLRDLS